MCRTVVHASQVQCHQLCRNYWPTVIHEASSRCAAVARLVIPSPPTAPTSSLSRQYTCAIRRWQLAGMTSTPHHPYCTPFMF
jgi:hypothetical protein